MFFLHVLKCQETHLTAPVNKLQILQTIFNTEHTLANLNIIHKLHDN